MNITAAIFKTCEVCPGQGGKLWTLFQALTQRQGFISCFASLERSDTWRLLSCWSITERQTVLFVKVQLFPRRTSLVLLTVLVYADKPGNTNCWSCLVCGGILRDSDFKEGVLSHRLHKNTSSQMKPEDKQQSNSTMWKESYKLWLLYFSCPHGTQQDTESVSHDGDSVMVWSCCGGGRPGDLYSTVAPCTV